MEIKIQTVNGMSIGMSIPDALISKIECGQCKSITGDVNGDGQVDREDAEMIMGHLSGDAVLNEEQTNRADVDGDGKITYLDAMAVMDNANGGTT